MARVIGAVVVDKEACKGCGVCVEECKQEVLELHREVNGKGYHYSFMKDPDCAVVCPDTCITVYRKKAS